MLAALVIFLDVPVNDAIKLMKKMGKKHDGHESDKQFLKNSRSAYLDAAKMFKYWQSIKCVKNNKLLTIDEIHNKIWNTL